MDRRKFILGTAAAALTGNCRTAGAQLVRKLAGELKNGEFNWFPERSPDGPILIIVSIPDQRVHVYRNGIRIAASSCSTGKPGHRTPTGVFKILQKDKHHRSSTYSDAPMPNMNRLTWSGIALHAGNLPGYPASHGCIRLPLGFSELLFGVTRLGMTVVIADDASHPRDIVHPGLVLGGTGPGDFAAADRAMLRDAYSEGHHPGRKLTSVVVSGADRRATVYEDGEAVASGPVTIGGKTPLGSAVHTLVARDPRRREFTWSSAAIAKTGREEDPHVMSRVTAGPKLREAIRQRMQNGMTVVATSQPDTALHRASGFTVIEGLY